MKKKQTHSEVLISNPTIKLETPEAVENFCKLLDEPDDRHVLCTIKCDFDKLYVPSSSEALEALERIKKSPNSYREETPRFTHTYLQDLDIIEKALKNNVYDVVEMRRIKKLNAFEIIKKKKVNVFILRDYILRDKDLRFGALGTYNLLIDESLKLTQEEFDLLKEVLL